MNNLDDIKQNITEAINERLEKALVFPSDLIYPPNPAMGDLSLPLFKLAKSTGKTPSELSDMLVALKTEPVAGISAAGPYLNFKLKKDFLASGVIKEIFRSGPGYGKTQSVNARKILIEYSNANTHKEYHIGHLRNLVYGDAVTRILAANGNEAIPVSYINDFGIHVAKTIWAYLNFYKGSELPENKGEFLGKVYARASQEAEKDKTAKQIIELIMKKIESRSGEEYSLWQETRQWSIDQFARIYEEVGSRFEKVYYESDLIDEGRKIVEDMKERGVLEESQGALIANLENCGLGVLMFLRSDGTALYAVADTALAKKKAEDFSPDESIYITDIRQKLHFRQLFKTLELYGINYGMKNLGYEFVKLPTGMMASRSGNVVTFAELRDQLIQKARKETVARHADWDADKISETARKLALGAMKFEMLKVGADQVITFDLAKALSFSGYTAAYLQYTRARIKSIFRKAGYEAGGGFDPEKLAETDEHGLILKMAKYPEAVALAGRQYDPSEIAKYLFDLAQSVNDYYHKIPVIKADEEVKNSRLSLLYCLNIVMENGLALLGIENLEEM